MPDQPRPARRDRQRLAWLALGHAASGRLELLAALAELEPDRHRLGERLARTLAGDDDAFLDLVRDDRPVRLSPALRARLRSDAVARACERALAAAAADPIHHLLTPADASWPSRLNHLDEPPAMLSVRGDPAVLDLPSVSIVGARRASRRGLGIARDLAHGLVEAGFAVVSGLAIGIDAAAHRGALAAARRAVADAARTNGPNRPATVAVLPTGPDRTYPPRNRALGDEILAHGALLSEFPLGQSLERRHFPIRNRLVAALSYGTLIVEAADRSGTLTTAGHAQAQNRELMVWPGIAGDPATAGGEALLADGASAVRTLDDLLACVLPALRNDLTAAGTPAASDADHASGPSVGATRSSVRSAVGERLLAALDGDPADLDELSRRTGLASGRALGELTRLELAGLARRDASGGYSRCLEAPGGDATITCGGPVDVTGLDASPRFELD